MVTSGFVESHIHLDKSCILERCQSNKGDLDEAIQEAAKAKAEFTVEDVYERGKRTLEKCIVNGTTHMRTHLEVDPVIGLIGLEGIKTLIDDYKWAMDIEICVFPVLRMPLIDLCPEQLYIIFTMNFNDLHDSI